VNERMNQMLIEHLEAAAWRAKPPGKARTIAAIFALCGDAGGVETFLRDGWARPWPAGPEMLCYMLAHEAHHRGQVCLLAGQMGFPLPKEVGWGCGTGRSCGWRRCQARGRLRAQSAAVK
jgi:hypothetical protein